MASIVAFLWPVCAQRTYTSESWKFGSLVLIKCLLIQITEAKRRSILLQILRIRSEPKLLTPILITAKITSNASYTP
jgi:hypothetical protein